MHSHLRSGTMVDPGAWSQPSPGAHSGTVTGGAWGAGSAPASPSAPAQVATAPLRPQNGGLLVPNGTPPLDIQSLIARYSSGAASPQPWGRNALAGPSPYPFEQQIKQGWGQAGAISGINNLRGMFGGS